MRRFRPLIAAAMLCVSACKAEHDQPGTITADDARQLNEAAAMLDANSMDANAAAPDTNESDSAP